ncbi:MAG: ribosome small subunit-dependent GTPase A [Gemmatimonadota bacterium]|nr:ribosome small subunit-dependent GTPase A [Gemmatimonadota bacterium]
MVLSKVGGRYRLYIDGATFEATLRGRLKQGLQRILVGDRVRAAVHSDESVTIDEVEPRRSVLQRRMPGRSHGIRHVAANVDQVVVVGAARRPDWDSHLIDRFVAVAAANQLPVILVLNKCDLWEEWEALAAPYVHAGYTVVCTSVPEQRGLEALRSHLTGHTTVLTGPTGVGKSSLLNALQPGLRLRTSDVSVKSGGGRHTTVSAEMHPFGAQGFVVDTPGLRDIGLWGLDPLDVARTFPEFAAFAQACRFDNCRHLEEPGCAVTAASERGEVARSRLASYRRFLEESERAARPWQRGDTT